jgi:hypothetical protein
LLAIIILYFIDHELVQLEKQDTGLKIRYIEYCVFCVFLLQEFLHLLQGLFDMMRGDRMHIVIPWEGVLLLFVCIIVSLGIYFSFTRLVADANQS